MRKLLCGVAAAVMVVSGAQAQPEREGRGDAPERQNPRPGSDRGDAARGGDERDGDERGGESRSDNRRNETPQAILIPTTPLHPERASDPARPSDRREEGERDGPTLPPGAQPGREAAAERQQRARVEPAREVRRAASQRVKRPERNRAPSRVVERSWDNFRFVRQNRGPIAGCPPGLRQRAGGCLPPGQAKRLYERRAATYRPAYFGYDAQAGGRYVYDDGYLMGLGDGWDVTSYIPLLGGALSLGNEWPDYYEPAPLPDYYVDYYGLGPSSGYRYADDVIYRVNPQSSSITSIIALLTGDEFAIGQPMPAGYDVYNVPYAYRDRYQDSEDARYRYADGYVYQSDPTSGLIQAAIELLI